jgi:superfamily I DNA and/or RNA helicase
LDVFHVSLARPPVITNALDRRARSIGVKSYEQYLTGQEMDRERSIAFRAQTKRLAKITINRAKIIAFTLATAATAIVANSYGFAEGLIIDEAARVAEPMIWPIMDKYPTLNWRILVGDPYQLPPVVHSDPKTNPFAHQLCLSQMQRL